MSRAAGPAAALAPAPTSAAAAYAPASSPTPSVLADADTTEARIAQLFLEFDTARSGRVPLQVLLHVLAEVDSPTALSVDEIHELLRLTGILNSSTLKDPRALYAMDVDYRAFVAHLLFVSPQAQAQAAQPRLPALSPPPAAPAPTPAPAPAPAAQPYSMQPYTGGSRR